MTWPVQALLCLKPFPSHAMIKSALNIICAFSLDCVSRLGAHPKPSAAFGCVQASLAQSCENAVAALLSIGSDRDSCIVAEGETE